MPTHNDLRLWFLYLAGFLALLPGSSVFAQSLSTEVNDVAATDRPLAGLTQPQQIGAALAATSVVTHTMPRYVTAPELDLNLTVTTTGAPLADGYLFAAPSWNPARAAEPQRGLFTMIFDNDAELVYYQASPTRGMDFKRQPDGHLSYFDAQADAFRVLDNQYQEVGVWRAGNGYVADEHDFILLPNDRALLMIYDAKRYDLSAYGGYVTATLISLVIQEVDQEQNVYFEWNSLDHIPITDTNQSLTTRQVDYIHGNSLEIDTDGNILLSSRHLDEVTKIDRTTGEIIWRLGGKQNQFTFIGDTILPGVGAFSVQHDARRLPNGNLSMMDNGVGFITAGIRGSRAVEYQLDEVAMTATFVKEYRTTPDVITYYMGNAQQLENGNMLVGWGGGYFAPFFPPALAITEFTSAGQVALQATYDHAELVSYRAFRFPWQGFPTTRPALVAITNTLPISLYYSWNGATEIGSYAVAGGATPEKMAAFAMQPKSGFEEVTPIDRAPEGACFFRITPYAKTGQPERTSAIVYLGDESCAQSLTLDPAAAASRELVLVNAEKPMTITLSADAGTVATTTVLALAAATPITSTPPGKLPVGFSFTMGAYASAYLAGDVMTPTAAIGPVQLEIDYNGVTLPQPETLSLARWDAAQQAWRTEGITILQNDPDQQKIIVTVAAPGTFALLVDNYRSYLPYIPQ